MDEITKTRVLWFLIGTFTGWAVVSVGLVFGGAILTMLFAVLPFVLPVIGIVAVAWFVWYLISGKNRR